MEDRDKALALGILSTAVALFGFLPNPVLFGSAIDSTCLVWEQSCGKRGSCWVYATDQFRCNHLPPLSPNPTHINWGIKAIFIEQHIDVTGAAPLPPKKITAFTR